MTYPWDWEYKTQIKGIVHIIYAGNKPNNTIK